MSVANPYSYNSSARRPVTPASSAENTRVEVLIFAKRPRTGACKTRLAAGMGTRATAIYRSLLSHAVAQAVAADIGPVTLVCAPNAAHPLFQRLARRHGVRLRRQARGSLGQRMHRAILAAHSHADHVLLLGSDQPVDIQPALKAARTALANGSAWLAPTTDGGYWAIGLPTPDSRAFRGPAWSTPRVARHTRTLIKRDGQRLSTWQRCRDIDDPQDWFRMDRNLRCAIARGAVFASPGNETFQTDRSDADANNL